MRNTFLQFPRLLAIIAFLITLSACSSKPPGCADDATLNTASGLLRDETSKLIQHYPKSLNIPPSATKLETGGVIPTYLSGLKLALSNIVANGYDEGAKRMTCHALLTVSTTDGKTFKRDIDYTTQKTEDSKSGGFLLSIQNFSEFASLAARAAADRFNEETWSGNWSGKLACGGVNGATEGVEGPYSQDVTVTFKGLNGSMNRTLPVGGTQEASPSIESYPQVMHLGANSIEGGPQKGWNTSLKGPIENGKAQLTGFEAPVDQSITPHPVRECHLELAKQG